MSYTESTISLDRIRDSLEQVIRFVGKEFIEKLKYKTPEGTGKSINHKAKKYGHLAPPRPHPLAILWGKGYANYQEFMQRRQRIKSQSVTLYYSTKVTLSKELLELFDIGNNLKEIETIPWISKDGEPVKIDSKHLWGERLRDSQGFEKAIYEIRVAASLKRNGYTVYFIKEEATKTPDLLVEKDGEKVYVECKQKDKKTRRDQRNENLWNTVLMDSLKFMDKTKKNYAIVVKTNSDLTTKDVTYLINHIRNLIKNSNEGTYRIDKFEIILKELAEFEKPIKGSFYVNLEEFGFGIDEPTIILYQHADIKFSNDLKIEHKNPRFVAFVSTLLPDRIKGILRSLNHAYKQIPKSGPGIVYIDINTALYKNRQEITRDLTILRKRIEGKLNLMGRLNAVILTASSYFQDKEKTFYGIEIASFKNSNPIKPLSKQFLDEICKVKIR